MRKNIVSISFGTSENDYEFETEFLGQDFSIRRIGTDGDIERVADLLKEWDGKADAIGLGNVRFPYDIGPKRVMQKQDKKLKLLSSRIRTPVTTGNAYRNVAHEWSLRFLQFKFGEYFNNARVFFLSGLSNYRIAKVMSEYTEKFPSATYHPTDPSLDHNPIWDIEAQCAFPSATQNEINAKDAENLLAKGVYVVSEGANMPSTPDAVNLFVENKILYGPGKAANAGGVAVSGLEMSQNSLRLSWTREEVDQRLSGIMKSIHTSCVEAAEAYGCPGNYVNGANIAGFLKVADTMLDQGLV